MKYLSALTKKKNKPTNLHLKDRNVWSLSFGRVTKLHFKNLLIFFPSVKAPFCAPWQNWLRFQMHLSELSAISSTLLLFGYAARLFQHVFTERRRCHLNMAKQNCDSLSRIRQTLQFGVRHTACLRLQTPPDFLSACTAPARSWSFCRKITR